MKKEEMATLGGGCFWCTEAVFQIAKGVNKVVSGYTGGIFKDPTYREVCSGKTGHNEVIQISFNPEIISYEEVLGVFFSVHDPTTLNQQGADRGTQYRSGIYYHSEEQKAIAEKMIAGIDEAGIWSDPVVTEVVEAPEFFPAEEYHQNYYRNNPNQGYCQAVVGPKVAKFRSKYSHLLEA